MKFKKFVTDRGINVYQVPELVDSIFEYEILENLEYKDMIRRGNTYLSLFRDCAKEIWGGALFLKGLCPKYDDFKKEEINSITSWARELDNMLVKSSFYQSIQDSVAGDIFLATIASQKFLHEYLEAIESKLKEESSVKELGEARREVQSLAKKIEYLDEQKQKEPDALGEHFDQQIEDAQQQREEAINRGLKLAERVSNAVAKMTAQIKFPQQLDICEGVFKEVEQAKQIQESLGFGLDASKADSFSKLENNLSLNERLKLHSKIKSSKGLFDLLKQVGRFKNILGELKPKMLSTGLNINKGVDYGNRIIKAVPSEMALLADPRLKPRFMGKAMSYSLAQHRQVDKKRLGKGNLILLRDVSGSTHSTMGGITIDSWIGGVVWVMTEAACQQNRQVKIINFGSSVLSEAFFDKSTISKRKLIDEIAVRFSSGTSWDKAMEAAMKWIEKTEPKKKAYCKPSKTPIYYDIVLLTDGYDSFNETVIKQFKEFQQKTNISLYSMLISEEVYKDSPGYKQLKGLSEKVLEATNLTSDSNVKEIFKIVE